jgi:hypothetical protein
MTQAFTFSKAGRDFLAAFVATMIGDAALAPDKPSPEAVAREIEHLIGRLPALHRAGFGLVLRAIEMGPLVFGYRRAFGRLKPEERMDYLRRLEESENYVQRALSLMLKTAVFLTYFSYPAVEAAIGYDHHCLLKAKPGPDRH